MSVELAVTLPVVLVSGILAYIAASVIADDKAGLKSFFTSMSLLFSAVALFTVSKVAEENGYTGMAEVLWQGFAVWVFIIIVFVLYLFIMYMKDTTDLAAFGRWR